MKKFRIYRSIRVQNIEDVNLNKLGISWAAGESEAADFSHQFGVDYIVISAVVTEDMIDIAQTNAQWNDNDTSHEGEVVLKDLQDITIEYNNIQYEGRIDDMGNDDTRPHPEECEATEITEYLEEA